MGLSPVAAEHHEAEAPEWSFNATLIEACSCPMFCQCYFNTEPAAHSGHGDQGAATTEHFCKFNIAYQVNEGHYGETKLQGARFWIAGDLGHDFSEMETDWAVLTFDPGTSPEAREALGQIIPKIYPFKWRSFSMGEDAEVVWEMTDSGSHASLGWRQSGRDRSECLSRDGRRAQGPEEHALHGSRAKRRLHHDAQHNRNVLPGRQRIRVQGLDRLYDHPRPRLSGLPIVHFIIL